MKKFLALLLACVLMLSSVLSVSASETPAADVETEEVITLLKYLNIITDGENLDEYVTRGDFAVYAAKLMKLDTEETTHYFDDVETSSKAAGSINALAEYGYISSGEGVSYMPYNNVRTNEALKVFLSMLGYKELCEAQGGYPAGYIKIANRIGLNKGIGSPYLSRGQLYALMYRTLTEPLCVMSSIDGDGSMTFEKDEDNNILLQSHELHVIEGYVNTVGSIVVDMEQPLDEGQFRIEDKIIRTDLISIDMYEYLGTNVKVYYFEEDGIKATAAIVIPYSEKNDVLSIKKDDIAEIQDGGKGYIFRYFDENDKEKKVEIPRGAVILKNGETVLVDVFDELQIDKGSYKFVDTDGNGKYDILFVYEYYNIVVGTVEDKEGMVYIKQTSVSDVTDWIFYRGRVGSRRAVYDKYTNDLNINLTEDGSKIIKYKDASGNAIDLADITKDEVISIYKSKSGNYIEVHKGKDPVRGEIAEISTTTDDGETVYEITVNDKVLKIAQSVVDKVSQKLTVGLKATFYLDCFGEVGAYVPDALTDVKFAYLVAVAQDSKGLSVGKTMVKMFTQDGELGIFNCADKIKIDGATCKESEDAFDALSTHVKEPIRYSVDEDNNLTFVDTLYYDAKLEGEVSIYQTMSYSDRVKYSYMEGSFSDTQIFKSTTPVLCVPADSLIDENTYQEDHFFVKKYSNLGNDSTTRMVGSFKVDRESVFDDLVITKSGSDTKPLTKQDVYLIDSMKKVLNKDGDAVQCVYAYLSGTLTKINCTPYCEDLTGKLNKGDIVWFDTNEAGEIKSIVDILVKVDENGEPQCKHYATEGEHAYAVALGTYGQGDQIANRKPGSLSNYFSMVYGYAGKVRDGALCFAYNKDNALNGVYDFVRNVGTKNIVVFDKEQGTDGSIYKSGLEDIITVANSYEDCSRVFLFMRNHILNTIFVYK